MGAKRSAEDAGPEVHELGLVQTAVLVLVEDLYERHGPLVMTRDTARWL